MSAVSKRYARALFEVASDNQTIEATETELVDIASIIEQNEELKLLLTHPKISSEDKKQMMNELFAGNVSEATMNFINLILERGREESLLDIVKDFTQFANEARGIVDAVVTTAKPLGEQEINELAKEFGQKLNKTLRVTTEIDPSIIGGVIVRIGDRLYDGSIKGRLARFTQQIKQAQV
jgi:F-type H+-transporting ATPase subunit delta